MEERTTLIDEPVKLATGDVVATFVDAWALMTGRYVHNSQHRGDGVAVTFSQTVCPFLNMTTLDRPLPNSHDFSAAIEAARGHSARCPYGSMVAICDEWAPADWRVIAADAGLAPGITLTGMAANRLLPPRYAEPDLTFRLVEDVAIGRDLGIVNALAYDMSPELFAPTADLALWQGPSVGIVGYAGSLAVTATAAFATDNIIYIAFVASLPDLHGRGYAEAAMRRAIAAAEQLVGSKPLWLHATEMGRPLYASMGFETGTMLQTLQFS